MKTCVLITVALVVSFNVALADDGLIEKYRHNYTALEEQDVDPIIKLLRDPTPAVRSEAVKLTGVAFRKGFMSARRAIPTIIELFLSDTSEHVRYSAATTLNESGDSRAPELLCSVATEDGISPMFIACLLDNLGEMEVKCDEVKEVAWNNIHSDLLWLRYQAIRYLTLWTDRETLKRLLQEYIDFRERPDTLLMKRRPESISMYENAYEELASYFAIALGFVGDNAPELLEQLLNSSNPQIRFDAAEEFSFLSFRAATKRDFAMRALPVLCDILKNDADWKRRSGAARALGRYALNPYKHEAANIRGLGDRKDAVISALSDALNDDYVEFGQSRPVGDQASHTLSLFGVRVEKVEGKEGQLPTYRVIKEK